MKSDFQSFKHVRGKTSGCDDLLRPVLFDIRAGNVNLAKSLSEKVTM